MKATLLFLNLVLLASIVQGKERYLVLFKSAEGFRAMQAHFARATGTGIQKTLPHVQAMVLETDNEEVLQSLANHPEISMIEKEKFIPPPKPFKGLKLDQGKLQRQARAQQLKFQTRALTRQQQLGSNPFLETPEFRAQSGTPWGILAVNAGLAWAHSGAGSRARVLVLDSGIDAEHPSIAPNFEKGRNFVDADPNNFGDPDGHGTHCAGTILGAYNEQNGFTGVAPRAKLLMGRVCKKDGCSSIGIIEGINWGIQERVDVISMSLSGPLGSEVERQAVMRAEQAGVTVVAASGNDAEDPKYSHDKQDINCIGFVNKCGIGFPAAFPTVVAVGAVSSDLTKASFSQWSPELDITAPGMAVLSSVPRGSGRESAVDIEVNGASSDAATQSRVTSRVFSGTDATETPVYAALVAVPGVGKPEDFAGLDVEGKVVLIARGEIKFVDKVKNAIAARAAGILIYNNAPGMINGTLAEDGSTVPVPVVMIEQREGLALLEELSAGARVMATVAINPTDYSEFQGTSMATPHVAGVVALMRSANKRLTPAQIRTILSLTARRLSPNNTNQFGAGMVQADQAVLRALEQP